MHSHFNTAAFPTTTTLKTRLWAAVLGSVFGLGATTLVVGAMAQQSDGQSLQAFMASQASQRVLAAAGSPVPRHGV